MRRTVRSKAETRDYFDAGNQPEIITPLQWGVTAITSTATTNSMMDCLGSRSSLPRSITPWPNYGVNSPRRIFQRVSMYANVAFSGRKAKLDSSQFLFDPGDAPM